MAPPSSSPLRVLTRRELLTFSLAAGGFALGLDRDAVAGGERGEASFAPNPFVHIGGDGAVTIVCHRSEMGQGVRSTVPMIVAAELGADPKRVLVVQGDGDRRYGDQNTDGSSSIRKQFDDLRRAGAGARTMLIAAAAKRWKVDEKSCRARAHAVEHAKSGRSLPFEALVAEAAKLGAPKEADIVLRPKSELGLDVTASQSVLDAAAIVRGAALYGADVRVDGMLHAVIARPPAPGAKVTKLEASRALAIPGVKKVVSMPEPKTPWGFQPWGGVAVLATSTWAALKGRSALVIEWSADGSDYDSDTYREELFKSVRAPGTSVRSVGDADKALSSAKTRVEAEYYVPHLAHLTMEPPTALARYADGRCELWLPTQHPMSAKKEVARVLGIDEASVTVHVTLLGGGFGRKSKPDFASEAAFLSREIGAPVRVQWTRDDDIRHDYCNTVAAQRLAAGLDDRGRVTAWTHRTAFPPIGSTFGPKKGPGEDDLQQGVLDFPLDVPNVRAEACEAKAHGRIGWYRSVYNIFHAFAIGSFIDEIAHARGIDPLDMWREIIGKPRVLSTRELGIAGLKNYGETLEKHPVDAGRLSHVLDRVATMADWSTRKQRGKSLGIAAHRSFVAYVAAVVSVVPDPEKTVRVDEAWICIDAGTVANLERAKSQMEGAVVMGIANALMGGITMKKGAVEQSSFREARIPRIGETPRAIHVEIVPSDGPPCGVGEPGVPPVGAAIANAMFAATGKRIRQFPLV